MNILLDVNNIAVVYSDIIQVLRGVSLQVPEGKIVALLGSNGAGKTTTLRAVTGLLKPENGKITEGKITFNNTDITQKLGTEVVKLGGCMVPEGRRVFKHLNVEENLRSGSMIRKDGTKIIKDDLDRVYSYFPKLTQIRNREAGYCSGGEQQMIAIGRALMAAPKMLILDEPSLGLAPLLVKEIFGIIKQINIDLKKTILVVEQNAKIAFSVSDFAYIMDSGRIVLEGPVNELKDNPDVKEFYLGMTEQGGRKSFKNVKSYKRRQRWM